jgi:hypothetical protein
VKGGVISQMFPVRSLSTKKALPFDTLTDVMAVFEKSIIERRAA